MAFEVKGDRAQWRVVYDRIRYMTIGDVVTDDELKAVLPETSWASIVSAMNRAIREVEQQLHRTLERVRLTGYVMVEAREHERLGRKHHKRAKRQITKARQKIASADESLLTPEERKRFRALEDHLRRHQSMIRRLDDKVEKLDQEQARTQKDLLEKDDRLELIENILRRHGIMPAK